MNSIEKAKHLENKIKELKQYLAETEADLEELEDEKPDCDFNLIYTFKIKVQDDEIWTNFDGPFDPSIEDVMQEIENAGGPEDIFYEWNLDSVLFRQGFEFSIEKLPAPKRAKKKVLKKKVCKKV